MKRQKRKFGDVLLVPLDDGQYGFAQVLSEPLMVFFDLRAREPRPVSEILSCRPIFTIWVMNHAVTSGAWKVIGHGQVPASVNQTPFFFKKDPINGKLAITRDGSDEIPVSREDVEDLEAAAVWEPNQVIDRLSDFFAKRPNVWVEKLKP